jgi:Transmembrane protein 43
LKQCLLQSVIHHLMNPARSVFSALFGALFGIVLFGASFPLIFWNENRGVKTERSLGEGRKTFVAAKSTSIDSANNNRLIYVTGEAAARPLIDPVTHMSVTALVLERKSEMYQWIERSEKSGSGRERTYSYQEGWHSGIDSHQGGSSSHRNPVSYVFPSGTETVPQARLGQFQVPAAILQAIGAKAPFIPEARDLEAIPAQLRGRVQLSGSTLYLGKDPSEPAIGDERVSFRILPPGPISVIARQVGDSLAAHTSSNGREILLAESGIVTPETMFEHAFAANRFLTWMLRAAGALVMFIGVRLLIEPITEVTDWIPIFGSLIDLGATLASGVLAVSLSLVTIAVAWFAVRPLLSGGLLVAACGLVFWVRRRT